MQPETGRKRTFLQCFWSAFGSLRSFTIRSRIRSQVSVPTRPPARTARPSSPRPGLPRPGRGPPPACWHGVPFDGGEGHRTTAEMSMRSLGIWICAARRCLLGCPHFDTRPCGGGVLRHIIGREPLVENVFPLRILDFRPTSYPRPCAYKPKDSGPSAFWVEPKCRHLGFRQSSRGPRWKLAKSIETPDRPTLTAQSIIATSVNLPSATKSWKPSMSLSSPGEKSPASLASLLGKARCAGAWPVRDQMRARVAVRSFSSEAKSRLLGGVARHHSPAGR